MTSHLTKSQNNAFLTLIYYFSLKQFLKTYLHIKIAEQLHSNRGVICSTNNTLSNSEGFIFLSITVFELLGRQLRRRLNFQPGVARG
jgi:hypothetical protein